MSSISETLSTQIAVFYLVLVPAVAAAAYILRHCFVVLRQGESMVLERSGRFLKILTPGFHMLAPFVDRPRALSWRTLQLSDSRTTSHFVKTSPTRIDMRQQVLDFSEQDMLTMDNIPIQLGCTATLEVADVKKAAYSVQSLADSIELLLLAELRAIISQQAFSSMCSSWDIINTRLHTGARGALERWGVRLLRASVSVINIPNDIKEALDFEIHEEKERRAYILEADGARESAITRSRGAAAQTVLLAEADKAVSIQRARGDAEAKIIVAQVNRLDELRAVMWLTLLLQAEADSISQLKDAVKDVGVRATDYLTAIQVPAQLPLPSALSRSNLSLDSHQHSLRQYLNSLSKVTMDSSNSEVTAHWHSPNATLRPHCLPRSNPPFCALRRRCR
jgi:regulator of protease activity HflC (stomatin/prohibitin superfamily)